MTHWEFLGASAPEWFKLGLDVVILPIFWFARSVYSRFGKLEKAVNEMPVMLKEYMQEHYLAKADVVPFSRVRRK